MKKNTLNKMPTHSLPLHTNAAPSFKRSASVAAAEVLRLNGQKTCTDLLMTIWGVYTREDVTSETSGGWVGGMRVVGAAQPVSGY